MSERKRRVIKAYFFEDERRCQQCKTSLSGESGMIYTVVPGNDTAFEFCSWRCMYQHTRQTLECRVAAKKQLASDQISNMGYDRVWDGCTPLNITQDELHSPIDDAI